jgi:HD-GYP domain-containing protein (c-di-GMP phosphodiesterase class II)
VDRYLPQVAIATLLVAVFPVVVVSALRAGGLVQSFLLTGALAIVLSAGATWAGSTWWKRRPESRDMLFCDLMVWGWVRRRRAERRLSDARSLLGIGIRAGQPTDVRRERQLDLFEELAHALEARDAYTHGHTRRVTRYASLIAGHMRLPREQVARVAAAAAVHDVGKINTPRAVLNKPGRLTDDEYTVVKRHPEDGANMVAPIGDEQITAMVRHHHERLDGTGYPEGLAGEEIPLGARIIAVADTFDALTSSRAYRGAMSHKQAMAILTKEAGTQLDPAAVRAFCEHYSGRRGIAAWVLLATAPERALAWLGGGLGSVGLGAAAPWVTALAVSVPVAGALAAAPLVSSGSHKAAVPSAQSTLSTPASPAAQRVATPSGHGAAGAVKRTAVAGVGPVIKSAPSPSPGVTSSGSSAGGSAAVPAVSGVHAGTGGGASPAPSHGGTTSTPTVSVGASPPSSTTGAPNVNVAPPVVNVTPPVVHVTPPSGGVTPGGVLPTVTITPPKVDITPPKVTVTP